MGKGIHTLGVIYWVAVNKMFFGELLTQFCSFFKTKLKHTENMVQNVGKLYLLISRLKFHIK